MSEPYKRAIWWSVEDFAYMAEHMFDSATYVHDGMKDKTKAKAAYIKSSCKDWKDYYDENMFEKALDEMIEGHDAQFGITWDNVTYCINEYCIREQFKDF